MKRLQAVIMILVLLCISSACGNEKEKSEDSLIEIIDYEAEYQAEEINDVINEAWNKTAEEKTDSAMLLSEYIVNVFPYDFDGEAFELGYCSDNQNLYLLRQYYIANEAKSINCLYSFDGNSKVTSMVQYDLKQQGLDGMFYEPYAVDGRVFSSFPDFDESTHALSSYRCVELLEAFLLQPGKKINLRRSRMMKRMSNARFLIAILVFIFLMPGCGKSESDSLLKHITDGETSDIESIECEPYLASFIDTKLPEGEEVSHSKPFSYVERKGMVYCDYYNVYGFTDFDKIYVDYDLAEALAKCYMKVVR